MVGQYRLALGLLFAAVVCVLLIACARVGLFVAVWGKEALLLAPALQAVRAAPL